MMAEIFLQDLAEVLFRRAIWRTVVIGEIEMGKAPIEGTADYGAAGFKDVFTAEVLPEAERDGRQNQAGASAAAEGCGFVAFWIELVTHRAFTYNCSDAGDGRRWRGVTLNWQQLVKIR